MGCASSSREANPNETLLKAAQQRLGFQKCQIEEVVTAFQTWSVGQIVLRKHLQAIAKKLSLDFDSREAGRLLALLELPSSPTLSPNLPSLLPTLPADFQSATDPVYSKLLLIILGSLLAQGSNTTKGRAIIQCFDEKCTGEFYSAELKIVVRDMYRVACEILPELVKEEEWTAELRDYVEKGKKGIDAAVDHSVALILDRRRSVNVEEFADKLEEYKGSELAYPTGLRTLAATPAS